MRRYVAADMCLMAFLRRELDDPQALPCGRCAPCAGTIWQIEVPAEEVAEAAAWLRSSELVIEPRQRWMTELPGLPSSIPVELRLCEGRSLSVYDDGGWGTRVRKAKSGGVSFPEELMHAAARLVRRWAPDPAPEWVTCVPSASHPQLVSDLGSRLGAMLGLPFREAVRRTRPGAPQKEMENSAQQLRNVHGAFAADPHVPPGPVLLVDDIHDSRWTLTVVGAELRAAGSGPVYPLTLARALSR